MFSVIPPIQDKGHVFNITPLGRCYKTKTFTVYIIEREGCENLVHGSLLLSGPKTMMVGGLVPLLHITLSQMCSSVANGGPPIGIILDVV